MKRILLSSLLLGAVLVAPALAVKPDEMLADPALESRARALSAELRCMVCQNENIDDSDADLARDIRLLVRERLSKGDSNAQVLDFLVSRYGQFILLKPRFELQTLLLWGTPPLVFLIGALAALYNWRRAQRTRSPASLRPEEEERLKQLMSDSTADARQGYADTCQPLSTRSEP